MQNVVTVHLGERTRAVHKTVQDALKLMEGHVPAVEWLRHEKEETGPDADVTHETALLK